MKNRLPAFERPAFEPGKDTAASGSESLTYKTASADAAGNNEPDAVQ
jgi:hypothetical protein